MDPKVDSLTGFNNTTIMSTYGTCLQFCLYLRIFYILYPSYLVGFWFHNTYILKQLFYILTLML